MVDMFCFDKYCRFQSLCTSKLENTWFNHMRALAPPPRSTFWVADMSLTSLFSLLKLSLVVAQDESTFSEGNSTTNWGTHTWYTHVSGYSSVNLAGRWSSNKYKIGTAFWPNASFGCVSHFCYLDGCNISPENLRHVCFSCFHDIFEGTLLRKFLSSGLK